MPPPTSDCEQVILHACQQAGFTPTTRYITADITVQLALARSGFATALVPQTAIDPATPGISAAPIKDHPDPAPPVHRDPSHRNGQPDDRGRHRGTPYSSAAGAHHVPPASLKAGPRTAGE
ncbi:LysR substrate-binding domain-containing protein [Streptomyces roseolilacinus]|uniref:LysR substrate-binding domain-containing protein n=1 Tax=Streptomyces roseolilacinus TaxID=66904 RepID=UPI0035711EA0